MSRNVARQHSAFLRCLFPGTIALALIAMPVSLSGVSSDPLWNTALAKKGGDKGGKGGGGGKGNDNSRGGSSDKSGDRSHGKSRSVGGKAHGARGASESGFGRADRNIAKAKDRYREALTDKAKGTAAGKRSTPGREAREVSHRFSTSQTRQLIDKGWQAEQPLDGFKNHGQRVRTMVELAKRLGYGARVGALQANFGTPHETGVAELQAELEAARAEAETNPDAAAKVTELEAALALAMNAKPGNGPGDDWAAADLDVNQDGVVDRQDLAALGAADGGTEPDDDEDDVDADPDDLDADSDDDDNQDLDRAESSA